MQTVNIFWFRRDLRLEDNAGLYHALKGEHPVIPLFIFDTNILDKLEDRQDARVTFIYDALEDLQSALKKQGSTLVVKHGEPLKIWQELLKNHTIKKVYTNHDFEPYAIKRDKEVTSLLEKQDTTLHTFKDHVIFEKGEILKADGTPYVVFTPFSRKWKAKLDSSISKDEKGKSISYYLKPYPSLKYTDKFWQSSPIAIPSLQAMNFERTTLSIPDKTVTRGLIKGYDATRNFPAIAGTSQLGIHFRFGTISIREKAQKARHLNETYLNELIWRDFYATILAHFPHVAERPFRSKYEKIPWRHDDKELEKWCTGHTGYPMVDAGMRELNATGFMHNRVRMVTASFFTKHLLMDYRVGEAYFAKKLLDYDLASNNGGWQWAAGCGTDAAPYFRIFNPTSQQQKFDKELKYIKKWVPEYGTDKYSEPIIDHKMARERCLSTFKEALSNT